MYINKALIFGNLTRDPELRALPSGVQVVSFSIATNRVYKDKNGVKQEQADFHNVVAFGRQAELVSQYLRKGSSAYIEGRMQTRSWESEGVKKYRTEIVADTIQFGPKSSGSGAGGAGSAGSYGGGNSSSGSGAAASATGAKSSKSKDSGAVDGDIPPLDTIEYPAEDIKPEDIPF